MEQELIDDRYAASAASVAFWFNMAMLGGSLSVVGLMDWLW